MQSPVLSHLISVEFPELRQAIDTLKSNNAHFKFLMRSHDFVDEVITSVEEGKKTMTEDELKTLKIKRLHLKDEMYQMAVRAK